ncbi:class I SAM-dependent methyltransferase [Pleomorphomonas oryzae]|uniref:class I SAM-dependent methyltransferase n=1 Tax=Pleomorphomonas oryzae TaxID=261934 RepID=UPI000411AE7D|nr:class I SAM-dependent methyltransferase [Pleomorphomonas oryzae]
MVIEQSNGPEPTAERVALWRALHVLADPQPHVLDDQLGLELAAPPEGWRSRGDMHLRSSARARASIVARSRMTEDLVVKEAAGGTTQYVLLGAGLDTFAQRMGRHGLTMRVFEIDQPGPQAWKAQRLHACGYGITPRLTFVPVDFEQGADWFEALRAAGFDPNLPAVFSLLGVTLYLRAETNAAILRRIGSLCAGTVLCASFMVPLDLVETSERTMRQRTEQGARSRGTPFVSFYRPEEFLRACREAGFGDVTHVSAADLAERYFRDRQDGLHPSSSEEMVIARL